MNVYWNICNLER